MTVLTAPTPNANGHRPIWPIDTIPAATRQSPQPTDGTDTMPTAENTTGKSTSKLTKADRIVLSGVAVALGAVILAPIGLSSQDLYAWATAPRGLGLEGLWPFLVPVALDLAAASCIGMTIVAAWRRDRPGVFGLLVWVFALTSAYAQYTHGKVEHDAGRAQDAFWAMPVFAVLGPLLLEVTLKRIRRWAREEAGEQHSGAAGFGTRWLPGVAFRETLSAWTVSRREGIDRAADAVQFVRDRQSLAGLSATEAVHYAVAALRATEKPTDSRTVRVWLSARNATVVQADIDTVLSGRPASRVSPRHDPAPVADTVEPTVARRPEPARPAPVAPDRKPPAAKGRQVPPKTDRPAAAVDGHSAAAVANAAELRRRYPDSLTDSDYQIRQTTGWSYDRLVKAKAAYTAAADRQTDNLNGGKS